MKEIHKKNIQSLLKDTQMHSKDTGSCQAQLAVLNYKIAYMQNHLKSHKKDKHNIRSLVNMVKKRNKIQKYHANNCVKL